MVYFTVDNVLRTLHYLVKGAWRMYGVFYSRQCPQNSPLPDDNGNLRASPRCLLV